MGRKIIKGEKSLKQVQTSTKDGFVFTDVYGIWQTEERTYVLNEDGTIPKNEYGNFDYYNNKLPDGCCYIDLPNISKICKKFKSEYVDAVIGLTII